MSATVTDTPSSRRSRRVPTSGAEAAALALVVLGAVALWSWDLDRQGTANPYYAAAAQAGGESWRAWFFGALDAPGAITVDKPPVSLWLMGLSSRLFGFSAWSLLLPQVLLGAGTSLVLHAAVRLSAGPVAGLVAAATFAATPVVTLMSRYDNPDAALTFLLVLAAYAAVRVSREPPETGRAGRWAVLVGVVLGLAFLTKTLQAFLVLPALLVLATTAIPGPVRRRVRLLGVAAVAFVLSAGWWIALVEFWPAARRPYVGGSLDDSIVRVILGLNGASRLTGESDTALPVFAGSPGPFRLYNGAFGAQIGWFLPAAAVLGVLGLALTWKLGRTDPRRAGYLFWGTWTVVHALTFSFAGGVVHSYYVMAMTPGVAALVGMGVVDAVAAGRAGRGRRVVGAALAVVLTAGAAAVLLRRAPDFLPLLGPTLLVLAVVAAVLIVRPGRRPSTRRRVSAAVCAGAAMFGGPVAWSVATVGERQSGSDPQSGPFRPEFDDRAALADPGLVAFVRDGQARNGTDWGAAAVGVNDAAPLQLASGVPVVMLGGFDGLNPGPPLERVQAWVREGRLRYVVDGTAGFSGGSDARDAVATATVAWARATGRVVPVPGSTAVVHDLGPSAGGEDLS